MIYVDMPHFAQNTNKKRYAESALRRMKECGAVINVMEIPGG